MKDIRKYDPEGCDQLYGKNRVYLSDKLMINYGPTSKGSARSWDMLWMSLASPVKKPKKDGWEFEMYHDLDVAKPFWIRVIDLGGTFLFALPEERDEDIYAEVMRG